MTGLRRNRRRYGGWRRPPPEHPGRGDRHFSALNNHAISACAPRWEPEAHERLVAAALQSFIVQGTGIRTVDRKGRVWFDDDLRLVTLRRTFLGTLVLKNRDGGQKVRLLPGATKVGLATQTMRGKALMAQVPPELLPCRFNDDGQRTPFLDVTALPGQVKVIKALMLALCARGAAPAS